MAYHCVRKRKESDENQKIPDAWHKAQKAGKGWYYRLLEKRDDLSLRTPEPLGRHRALMANDRVLSR